MKRAAVPADQVDQEMLQVKTDYLLCPELVRVFQRHVLKIRIVQTAVEAPPCFGDDLCKQIVFGLIDLKMPFLKKTAWPHPDSRKRRPSGWVRFLR